MKRVGSWELLLIVMIPCNALGQAADSSSERNATIDFQDAFISCVSRMRCDSSASSENKGRSVPSPVYYQGNSLNGVFLAIETGDDPDADTLADGDLAKKLNSFHEVSHFNCSQRSIKPFVSTFGSGPLYGLLYAIGREDTINHGFPASEGYLRNTLGNLGSNKIKMRGCTTDHGAKTDDRIILLVGSHLLCK